MMAAAFVSRRPGSTLGWPSYGAPSAGLPRPSHPRPAFLRRVAGPLPTTRTLMLLVAVSLSAIFGYWYTWQQVDVQSAAALYGDDKNAPTNAPTDALTEGPTGAPTDAPINARTDARTDAPTNAPTAARTSVPTNMPVAARTKVPKIKVDFYGGSISLGGNVHKRNRFPDIIGKKFKQIEIQNKAIGGSGTSYWLHCGIQPADVIVSEFRINEWDYTNLQKWYMLTSKFAQHTVVLDLWSWLTPPDSTGPPTYTESALNELKERLPHINQTFSFLSLSNRDKDVWRKKVPKFFNYTDTRRPIPKSCFTNLLKVSPDKKLIEQCRKEHANNMQHGREPYHRDVASSLAKHMKEHVLPFISPGETPSSEMERLCIGSWGMDRWGDPFKEQLIVGETTFQFSNPFSERQDKLTLNANLTSSTVRLDCPAPYNWMKLGHITHSDLEESVVFEVNGKNISTHDHLEERPHIRIRKYTEQSFKTPLEISISSLHPGAYLELTDVVCTK